MALQDSFYICFELANEHYVLPAKLVFQVFHHARHASPSAVLNVDELIVFEGQPYYLRQAEKLFRIQGNSLGEVQKPTSQDKEASWVIVLKKVSTDHPSAQKGFGFRVHRVTPPFECKQDDPTNEVNTLDYAGISYQCLKLQEQA